MKCVKITNPLNQDKENLKKLWKNIFKDDDSYIKLFFSVKYKPEHTFIIKENGELAAMLYAEETPVMANGEELNGVYFCGIATREASRGKGYAGMLIEYALEHFKDKDLIYLIPANQGLFNFYKKFSFKPLSYFTETPIDKKDIFNISHYTTEFDYEKLNFFYEHTNSDLYPKRSYEYFKAIYDCYKNFMIFDDGYIVYYIENNRLHIVEYTVPYEKAVDTGSYLLNKNNLSDGIILKRYGNTPFTAYKGKINPDDYENKYINLMLN